MISLTFFYFKAQTFQNLVPNGSFESYTNCPTVNGQIYHAAPWMGPTINSSDYLNACSSSMNVPYYGGVSNSYYYLNAKHGNAYAGFYSYHTDNFREYLQVKLIDSLIAGNCYYVEFFCTNHQRVKYKSNNIAASFTNSVFPTNQIYPGTLLNLPLHITNYGNKIIKDTVKWEQVSGIYQANNNAHYMVIGNFKDNSSTDTVNIYNPGSEPYSSLTTDAYVFIDAVSVFSINPTGNLPWSYRDTVILLGDSVYIGNTMGGSFNPQWYTMSGSYITTNAGIYVKPSVTNSYVVQYTVCGTPRADTVEVKVITDQRVLENELQKLAFHTFPNPTNNEITIEFENAFTKPKDITVTDVLGREVKIFAVSRQRQKIDLSELKSGCYFINLHTDSGLKITKKIVKE